MSVASSTIGFFRTRWASALVDSCVIKRQTGESFNSSTGVTIPTYTTQYSGACLWRPGMRTDEQFGEEQVELRFGTLFIPYDEDDPQVDDLVDMTSTRDGVLNGKQLVVRNVVTDTYNTKRALYCEDNQGG